MTKIDFVHLRDTLHNFADNSGASDEYCKGLLVGVVSGLMSVGLSFTQAATTVKRCMPPMSERAGRGDGAYIDGWPDFLRRD